MAKLTKRSIDAFRYGGGWDVRWDYEIPGFGVRVYPSGKKSFVLSYRNARGKKRRLVLGRYGADLTLDQARTRAVRESGRITEGVDQRVDFLGVASRQNDHAVFGGGAQLLDLGCRR